MRCRRALIAARAARHRVVLSVLQGGHLKVVVCRFLKFAHSADGLMVIRVILLPLAEAVLARHRRAAKAARPLVLRGVAVGIFEPLVLALGEDEPVIFYCHLFHRRAGGFDGQRTTTTATDAVVGRQRARTFFLQVDVQRRTIIRAVSHFNRSHRQRCIVAENKIDGFSTDNQTIIDGHVPRHHVPSIVQLIIAGQFRGVRADLLRTAFADIHHAVGKDFDRPLHAAVIFADRGRVAALIHILVAAGQQLICRLT